MPPFPHNTPKTSSPNQQPQQHNTNVFLSILSPVANHITGNFLKLKNERFSLVEIDPSSGIKVPIDTQKFP